MALLTKQQIIEANDIKFEDVEVPEWGGSVRVCCLTGTQRDAWEMSIFGTSGEDRNMDNTRSKMICRCVVDEEGNYLFEEKDIPALGKKSAAALDRVFEVCQRLNRLTKGDMDELVGNSKEGPIEDSTSV